MTETRARVEQSQARVVLLTCALTGAAGYGFFCTVSRPDLHPVIHALSLGWLISAFLAAFTAKALRRLHPKRFRFARWEREGGVYEWAGVRAFRSVLFVTGWASLLNRELRLKSGRSDLERLLRCFDVAEGPHAIAAVVTVAVAAGYVLTDQIAAGICLAGVNVPLNIYPVMLQRWNRGRVFQVQRRFTMHDQTRPSPRADSNLLRRECEAMAEPDGAANGSQPIRSETNQTSSAAGSRR